MASGMNARSPRRRGKLGWIAAAASAAYIFLAQQPLAPSQPLVFSDSEPRSGQLTEFSPSPGEPWEKNGRRFLARGDLQGASEIDRLGGRLWTAEFPSPATSVDVTDKLSAWGLLDGSIHVLAGDGAADSVAKPASMGVSSRFACVYGLALSPDGTRLAALYGLEPQHFVILERSGKECRLLHDMKLLRPVRSAQPFAFAADGKSAVGLTGDGVVFYDTIRGRASALRNPMLQADDEMMIAAAGSDGFAFLTAGARGRVAGLLRQGRIEAIFPVAPDSEDLIVDGLNLDIRGKSMVSRYKVENR